MVEQEILDALQKNQPFQGLRGVQIGGLEIRPRKGLFDVAFRLESGPNGVLVYAEIKNSCTPKMAQQIAPWLARLKSVEPDAAFAIVCPSLSPGAQSICIENNIDFIDLAGNISINVPGSKFVLQRLGRKSPKSAQPPKYQSPFGAKSSRVLRVLLQNPKEWRVTDIREELSAESGAILNEMKQWAEVTEKISQVDAVRYRPTLKEGFEVSLASISKVLRNLEDDLLVRRRNSSFAVPEPGRLLLAWAQKYKERYRWNLRSSYKCPNPFGLDLNKVAIALGEWLQPQPFSFTGPAAAFLMASYLELDTIDVFTLEREKIGGDLRSPLTEADWRRLTEEEEVAIGKEPKPEIGIGPDLRIIYPYDLGVFMYSRLMDGIPVVSDIQAFLDLYAKGDRELKQAEYLLEEVIEPRWEKM